MADNPPPTPPPSSGPRPTPPLKGTGLTGSLKNPTQRLPIPIRTAGGGKIVVMLSSVAKPPPASTQQLLRPPVPPASPVLAPKPAAGARPLPPKQVTPAKDSPSPSRPQLSATTYVKLPPKTTAPGWSALSGKPLTPEPTSQPESALPGSASLPPPKVAELTARKPGAQHIPPIKLNEPVAEPASPAEESIFLAKSIPASTPEGSKPGVPKTPMPITTTTPMTRPDAITPMTTAPEENPVSLDSFVKSQTPEARIEAKAEPKIELKPVTNSEPKPSSAPAPEAKVAPLKAPALMPPNLATPPPVTGGGLRPVRPPPLPPTLTKPMGSVLSNAPVSAPTPPVTSEVAAEPPKPEAPPQLPKILEPVVEKPAPAPAFDKQGTSASGLLAAELAIIAPMLNQPVTPTAEKLPPPLAVEPVETPVAKPPPLPITPPKLEKTPESVVEQLPPPLPKSAEPAILSAPALHVAPPPLEKKPEPVAEKLPPPVARQVNVPAISGPPLHVAPPMLEKAPEPAAERLPQPHLPPHAPGVDARKADAPPAPPDSASKPVQKAPAMISSEAVAPQPSTPPEKRKSITSWLKKTPPPVVSSAPPKAPVVAVVEAKPALKPPTLPSRSVPQPVPERVATTSPLTKVEAPAVEAPKPAVEAKAPEKASLAPVVPVETGSQPGALKSAAETAAVVAGLAADKQKSREKTRADAATKPPVVPLEPRKVEVPLTRAERAKRRQLYSLIFFWALLFPATIGVLFWASLQVGRDTRLEGQIIPPPGTVLSNEVWIVTDFRPLASGITEDLAAERTPLMQEIQERQDHVQRAQADVAAREERIRLIQEQIAAHKSEIESVVKQARDATQKVWDVEGAAVDNEYASRMAALKRTIADRAKSLNLKYTPDDTFDSPEVWANAYRLALYEVPAGVDGVKEHAWLSDQMKQWRDYQKSADDQKEALREKAAQIKLGPAPKITDLNAKIDELQQRIDATEAEEVPLKAELQQAQGDLVTAQSADVGLDDKYYKQLYSLPGESVIKRIPLATNGRFTWLDDNVFLQGENQHSYYIFARATRADGRQYWSLGRVSVEKNHVFPVVFEPNSFLSTKAILRPTLSPEDIEQ